MFIVAFTISALVMDSFAIISSLNNDSVRELRSVYEDVSCVDLTLKCLSMLQPFGTRYGRIMWTYLMTYSAFVANAVLGIFALIVLSMERRFQENNDLLMRIGHRTREDNTLVDELDKRVHAYYVLLQALRSVSELFQVRYEIATLRH